MTGFHPLRDYQLYRTQGLDVQISVKALAGGGPSEERKRTLPVMEFPARNVRMLHNKSRKSKGENHGHFKDLHARNYASYFISYR